MKAQLEASLLFFAHKFKKPSDVHFLVAYEVTRGDGVIQTVFFEVVTALGSAGRRRAQQLCFRYDLIEGEATPPYNGLLLGIRRHPPVDSFCTLFGQNDRHTLGAPEVMDQDELSGWLLELGLPAGYAQKIVASRLRFHPTFAHTAGFDHLIVHGIDADHPSITVPAAKKKKNKHEGDGAPDFLSFVLGMDKKPSAHDPPRPTPKGGPGPAAPAGAADSSGALQDEVFDLIKELEKQMMEDLPDEDKEEIRHAARLEEEEELRAGAADDADDDEAEEEEEIEHDAADRAAVAGPLFGPLDRSAQLLLDLGLEEKIGWLIHKKVVNDGDANPLLAKVNWMETSRTVACVCKRADHKGSLCKIMIRIPAIKAGEFTWADMLDACYRWIAFGEGATRADHLCEAVKVKQSFGMKPRA